MAKKQQSSLAKFWYEGRVHLGETEEDSEVVHCVGMGSQGSGTLDSGEIARSDGAGDGSPMQQPSRRVTAQQPARAVAAHQRAGRVTAHQPTGSFESDVQILEAAVGSPLFQAARKKKQSYELNRHFQDSWAARLPWAESVLGRDGRVAQVRCKICTEVEGREKLLVPKLDSLWKHGGRRKALVDFGKVKKGDHYFLSNCQHVKNERVFFARGGSETVAQLVIEGASREKKKKIVQFRVLFWLLQQGRPMSDFEAAKVLFQQLAVPNFPLKHWSTNAGWEMVDSMVHVLSEKTKQTLRDATYFSISADEVTTVDHESWLSIHVYVVIGFARCSMLLAVCRLVEGNGAKAVTETVLSNLSHHGGLEVKDIAEKCVCFGADGVAVFQGSRTGVTTRLKEQSAPFMMAVHCMAHRTNLAVQPLSNLPIVAKLESLCQAMYSYFSVSSKRHLEFQKLANIVETEGLRMLRNVATRWISLLEPLKRVMGEYKTLIVKMCEDAHTKEPDQTAKQAAARECARLNCDLLCDVSTLLALPCLLPLLESVNSLIKFAQSSHVYVSDYIAAVRICQAELYMMYVDTESSFQRQHFQMFRDIIDDHSYAISQEWVVDLNDGTKTLGFRINDHTYAAHMLCAASRTKVAVGWSDLLFLVTSVKGQCREAAQTLISELDLRFRDSDLMTGLSIVFPQFWLQQNCDELFQAHMKTVRHHYCVVRPVNRGTKEEPEMVQMDPLLDARTLGLQSSLFKLTMKSNSHAAMEEPRDRNPATKLWEKVGQSSLMLSRLSEFFKLAEIAMCAVLGSVEDERTFSTLGFMKSKVRNRLGGHLDAVVKMFSQPFYTQADFPYAAAITH